MSDSEDSVKDQQPSKILKRSHEGEDGDGDSDDSDGWIGPLPSEAAPQKKKKVLEDEKIYLENLPCAESYEKSYMHRDTLSHCVATKTDFIITASCDGHLKFWKKQEGGIEFVKHFRAHLGNVQALAANVSGTLLISVSNDKHGKVFDVVNFDMINIIKLNYVPETAAWIHQASDAIAAVAISDSTSTKIDIFDGRGGLVRTLERLHFKPVVAIAYNAVLDIAVSADAGGIVEYWSGLKGDFEFPEKRLMFSSKMDSDLFEFVKHKTHVLSLAVSPDGKMFAATSSDKKIRVFRFISGKLYCVIDESPENYISIQNARQPMTSSEFNKKLTVEKELTKSDVYKFTNLQFDRTGYFLLYPSLIGVKLVNLFTNKCVRVIGKSENLRCVNIALYQPNASSGPSSVEETASENPILKKRSVEPTLVCTGYKKNRFYLFTRHAGRDTSGSGDRDVFNEKPTHEDRIAVAEEDKSGPKYYETAVLHTTLGDVVMKLFPRECPKTVENFCGHAKNNYFNGHIFHRVIKQFMIQTGDPTGVGTGGESIWGGEFEDEICPKLRHDRPFTVSMANAGANSNGSQFFITVVPAPWLDNKHTVFGRVTAGMEIALNISNVKTHPKTDKPYDDISILSVSVKDPIKI